MSEFHTEILHKDGQVIGLVDGVLVIEVSENMIQTSSWLPANLEKASAYADVYKRAIGEYNRLKAFGKVN